jgi:hypothetical protein
MDIKEIREIIEKSVSKNDALLKIYGYANKRSYEKLNNFISEYNIDVSHFEKKPKFCKLCGKLITTSENKFCNSSCSAKFNNSRRKLSDETKDRISKKLSGRKLSPEHLAKISGKNHPKYVDGSRVEPLETKRTCLMCGKEFNLQIKSNGKRSNAKLCSKECRNETNRIKINERIKNGLHRGWITRNVISYPEKFFIEVLDNNNIKYIHNYPVAKKDLGLDDNYNYFLDFYIEDKKIDLEIDGKQHKRRKEHDDVRDKLLRKNGYIVYRIRWRNINSEKGKQYIKEEINKFLEFYRNS